jgi:hypothetical protein
MISSEELVVISSYQTLSGEKSKKIIKRSQSLSKKMVHLYAISGSAVNGVRKLLTALPL